MRHATQPGAHLGLSLSDPSLSLSSQMVPDLKTKLQLNPALSATGYTSTTLPLRSWDEQGRKYISGAARQAASANAMLLPWQPM